MCTTVIIVNYIHSVLTPRLEVCVLSTELYIFVDQAIIHKYKHI